MKWEQNHDGGFFHHLNHFRYISKIQQTFIEHERDVMTAFKNNYVLLSYANSDFHN
jgi:hypothetical protein